jgi:murein L,D-transpeptidase YcbB/YkuD
MAFALNFVRQEQNKDAVPGKSPTAFRISPEAPRRLFNGPSAGPTRATHAAGGYALMMLACLLTIGCRAQLRPQADVTEVGDRLNTLVASGALAELQWPNFGDHRLDVQKVYEALHFAPAWVHDGRSTPQALAVIAALESSQQKGLNPEDYDASRWPARLAALQASSGNADTVAHFDVALTVSAMRYLSNLHTGRMNPKPAKFDIVIDKEHYDLSEFLVRKVLPNSTLTEVLNEDEPHFLGYKRAELALQTYQALAAQDHSEPLPDPQRTVKVGNAYAGVEPLDKRLRLLGDLPQSAAAIEKRGVYSESLASAVKRFQNRHGLKSDGSLYKETLHQLNTPLNARVIQLQDSLERWRWLPADYPESPVMVNIPGFVLRLFSDDHHVAMRMRVVVGKALQGQTPVFAKNMRYIIFRPYWNIPLDITRTDIIPGIHKNAHYLVHKGYEVTDQKGHIMTSGTTSAAALARMQSGQLMVRQKPGPSNALGLVKFMFPNEYDVYLHSTPTPQLFKRSRRDFSHGCIRVEMPAELAAWLLRDQPKWTLETIKAAMNTGPDNQQVNLTKPVPVVIVYLTATVEENGEVYFYNDIYGRDDSLSDALAQGHYSH